MEVAKLWRQTLLLVFPLLTTALLSHPSDGAATSVKDCGFTELSLGVNLASHRYKEPRVCSMRGYIGGFFLRYCGRFIESESDDDLFIRSGVHIETGEADYHGSGNLSGTPLKKFELYATLGNILTYEPMQASCLTYMGLGYRYLFHDARGTTTTNHVGYRRSNSLLYMPIGVDVRIPSRDWTNVINIQLSALLLGKQTSYFSDIHSSLPDIDNRQGLGFGTRLSYAMERGNFSLGPYIEYWSVDQSDGYVLNDVIFVEPDNHTTEVGFELRYRF